MGVAVSGGADSVCLLHLLAGLAAAWNLRLTVLHLDHGLRGEESRADAEFVASLAGSLHLPFELRRVSLADAPGNREQAARTARLAFFREAMAAHRLDRVAVGHTRSDQAETVLFRFLRGAGTAGLAAIRPITPEGVVRPLLDLGREEVRDYLRARGFPWREDSSNAGTQFARNRIRHQLLPHLRAEWNPAIETTLAHTAEWALGEEEWWAAEIDRLAARLLRQQDGRWLLSASALRDLPAAPARRLIRHAIGKAKGDLKGIDFAHVETVLELASRRAGGGAFRASGVRVRRSFDWLCFTAVTAEAGRPAGYSLPAAVPGAIALPGQELTICMELIENTAASALTESIYNKDVDFLDWQRVPGPLVLRNWRPGDRYQPLGSPASKKLKALFQEADVPVWERSSWPVLTGQGSIVWTRRFGPAAGLAAGRACGPVLRIREIGNRDVPGQRLSQ